LETRFGNFLIQRSLISETLHQFAPFTPEKKLSKFECKLAISHIPLSPIYSQSINKDAGVLAGMKQFFLVIYQ